jgi:hypothetical protein
MDYSSGSAVESLICNNQTSAGESIGAGGDLDISLFKGEMFDLPIGLSYRYFKNTGGVMHYISKEQRLQTAALYLAPTFKYKRVSLALNFGYGSILQEKMDSKANSQYYTYEQGPKRMLNTGFFQYGAMIALNI